MSAQISVYEGIPQSEIEMKRKTSEEKEYTLNHPQELVVNMRFMGEKTIYANSQGWERSYKYYWDEVLDKFPECLSEKNIGRIREGVSPRVDAKFVEAFPQYGPYLNEVLIHHHIGKDGQAVAVPQSMHKGSGEIHMHENALGITENAEAFSKQCEIYCKNHLEMLNQTSDQLKIALSREFSGGNAMVKEIGLSENKRDKEASGSKQNRGADKGQQETEEISKDKNINSGMAKSSHMYRMAYIPDKEDKHAANRKEENDDILEDEKKRTNKLIQEQMKRKKQLERETREIKKENEQIEKNIQESSSGKQLFLSAIGGIAEGLENSGYVDNKLKYIGRRKRNKRNQANYSSRQRNKEVSIEKKSDPVVPDDPNKEKRKSPEEHMVNSPGQRRGKGKVFTPSKGPYKRPK